MEPETQMTVSIPMCFQDLLQNKTIQKKKKSIRNKNKSNKVKGEEKEKSATVIFTFKEEIQKGGAHCKNISST